MEAVPRLPMLSFQLKVSPEPSSFGPKLKQYIRDFYNEDAESYTNEIQQLESLRTMAVRPPIDMAGCLLLKKYYCQLHFLQSRFPMGKDGAEAITFTWRDTYANIVCSVANIRFEIISILYNIGAMHTQLGARTERTSAEGMKMSCTHFQCAAWAFEHLKNSYPEPSSLDLTPELMTFMHQLCLAQAQECILEKSMLDNRKPTIVAKVAKQIVDYFTLALATLEQGGSEDGTVSDTVGTKIYKSWKRYVKFKKAYHLAVTHLYQGLGAEEQRKMGERVAFYNVALTSLNEAHSIYAAAKGSIGATGAAEEQTAVKEALTFTNDVIEGKRKAAKNENEFIYHEEVPEKETLATVKGASLVKGISFSINDPEVSGPDIFARLVPMKVHEASSLYSEEKAKILRSVGAKVEDKDQQLNTYLASLKLEHMSLWDPDVQTTEWERLPLPDELVERCAALNAKQHVIQELVDIMAKLSDTSQDVEKILKEIKKLLLDEELKEKQYQDAVGKRPPSIVATDLTREAKKYEEAHNKASESNHALHKAITMHVKNLKILAQPLAELIAYVPSPSAYLSEQNSEKSHSAIELERMHTKELKRILNKVDEMRMQRSELHAKLRDSIAHDDLTRLLVTATSDSGPLDRLFADQLSKHQTLVNLIDRNLSAQDNILAALTDAYAQTANVRKGVEEKLKRREITVSSLIASYDAYEDLLAKSSKGLEFYRKLEINVSKLLQRVKSTCKVQEEEREQILAQDDKISQDKVDTTISPAITYEQSRSRPSSGLKLKDYLNSRTDNASSHQNQYYNLYNTMQYPQQDQTAQNYRDQTTQNYRDQTTQNYRDQTTQNYRDQTTQNYRDQTTQNYRDQTTPTYGDQTAQNYGDQTAQNYGDQTTQNYGDQTYLAYGSQVPINSGTLSYPSTYQSLQQGVSVSYPQNNTLSEASTSYTFPSCVSTPEIIQSHAKPTTVQSYSQSYQYPQQSQYYGYPACGNYPYNPGYNYVQGSQLANTVTEPYTNQAGYVYDSTNQCYQYNSSNLQTTQPVSAVQPPVSVEQPTASVSHLSNDGNYVYQQQESSAKYTNASSIAMVSQTSSSQYSGETYQAPGSSDIYYATQYGLQMQNQGPTGKNENQTNYNQTYMQAANNGTSTTTSANPVKTTTKSQEKSNVDLLSDLDVTINHAPLVPEVRSLSKQAQEELTTTSNASEDENQESKTEKDDQPAATDIAAEDKTENEKLQIVWDTWSNDVQPKKDPLGDPIILQKFVSEVEKYEKFVDSLLVKTLSGATNLDIKWKEVQDFEERESGKQSCTVALAHSSENRVMDCIPYDTTRVQLTSAEISNYINASHLMEITQWIPKAFIVTQAPLPENVEVFWTMIWEQECEVIACLASDAQLTGEIYWPVNEEDVLNVGHFTVSLKKRVNHVFYIQRIISVHHDRKKFDKTVVHMQFLAWPSNGFPSSPGALLTFSTDVMTEQAMRRCSPKPVVVHCLDGGALSSLFIVSAATVCHIRAGCGIVDVPLVFKGLVKCRKQVVNKESLLFAYRLVLYHAQDILMKRKLLHHCFKLDLDLHETSGILSSTRSTFENFDGFKGNKDKATRKMHPSDDFLHSLAVAAQRSDTDQQGRQKISVNSNTVHASSTTMQEKPNEGAIDPLSQLDPLWSIRR